MMKIGKPKYKDLPKLVKRLNVRKDKRHHFQILKDKKKKVPVEEVLTYLAKIGISRRNARGKFVPKNVGHMVNMEHSQILKYYNSLVSGILGRYSFAKNYDRVVSHVKYQIRNSCALTLSLKYKLRRRAKAFARFGTLLQCPRTGTKLRILKKMSRFPV